VKPQQFTFPKPAVNGYNVQCLEAIFANGRQEGTGLIDRESVDLLLLGSGSFYALSCVARYEAVCNGVL
jgi:hypothetical protein